MAAMSDSLGSSRIRPLDEGDPAPRIDAVDQAGAPVFSYADLVTGKPAVLIFYRHPETQAAGEALAGFRDLRWHFDRWNATLFAISLDGVTANAALHHRLGLGFQILADVDGGIHRAYGVDRDAAGPTLFVLDPAHRIARKIVGTAPADLAAKTLDELSALFGAVTAHRLGAHAPLLLLPRFLGQADCDLLIERWHRPVAEWGSSQSASEGHKAEQGDFKVVHDGSYGRATEYVLQDPELERRLDRIMRRRLFPELKKAFQTSVKQRERYRVSAYDSAIAGFLHPHRDNPIPAIAHRRFTVSVNLNAGDYEGGTLRFREYGEDLYEVGRGTAIVWSASLLHEVLPVTQGRRFILGTHLFGGEGAPGGRGGGPGT
jgi:peroxiredoxin